MRRSAILASTVKQAGWDWVTITSPEAAAVFIEAWEEAGKPSVRLAVVGGGTGEVLQQAGLKSDYVSTKALGASQRTGSVCAAHCITPALPSCCCPYAT